MSATTNQRVRLRRCVRCVMPDLCPGSDFDEEGVCRWCRTSFPNYVPDGEDALREFLERNKSDDGAADCMVGVSGGKDSSYVLLKLKRDFGMRVEAFTYIHEGTVGFSAENARRVCKALDVKHHIVSLPRHAHLEIFRKFFAEWVRTEDPLAAAMTCAGCKHLHILGTRLARQREIPIAVWAMCPLETPPFISTQPSQEDGYENASSANLITLGLRLGKSMLASPGFLAAFLSHCSKCVTGCLSFDPEGRFLRMRYPSVKHVQFFNYCPWNGDEIKETVYRETGWNVPKSVKLDWHSDCLFHALKEYMFQKMFYVSYTDAFLSNQIRHGLLSRERAHKELMESKRQFAAELPKALKELGMGDLCDKVDPSCFDVDDGE